MLGLLVEGEEYMAIMGWESALQSPYGGCLMMYYNSIEGNLGVECEEGTGGESRQKENFNPLLLCIIIVIHHH